MRVRTTFCVFSIVVLLGNTACDGDGDDADAGVLFEKPQILPDMNPICLSEMKVEVGEVKNHPVLLQNNGKQVLTISTATISNDTRNHFRVLGPDTNTVESRSFATMNLRYAPEDPGWDAIALTINSNAENYPRLDVYVIARAEPGNLDGGVYDAGARPPNAREACLDP